MYFLCPVGGGLATGFGLNECHVGTRCWRDIIDIRKNTTLGRAISSEGIVFSSIQSQGSTAKVTLQEHCELRHVLGSSVLSIGAIDKNRTRVSSPIPCPLLRLNYLQIDSDRILASSINNHYVPVEMNLEGQ